METLVISHLALASIFPEPEVVVQKCFDKRCPEIIHKIPKKYVLLKKVSVISGFRFIHLACDQNFHTFVCVSAGKKC